MTNEEITEFVKNRKSKPNSGSCWQALAIIDQLRKENAWIPVSERLPEKNGDYLVLWDTGVLEKIHFAPKFSTFYMKTNVSKVTHWKPISLPSSEEAT